MEEGTKSKRTVFVGNLGHQIDEQALLGAFTTFGDIVDATIPSDLARDNVCSCLAFLSLPPAPGMQLLMPQTYRGIAFLTYTSAADAQDAIDNMDMNVYSGRVLRVNLTRPVKGPAGLGGGLGNRAIWESEEWLQENAQKESAGVGGGKGDEGGDGMDQEE
ncbi:hypothetical protein CALCODRAFT_431378 [Calocera cornea HHB12733]|uniref:RRM domain-containing protein n=1 Tax=Calocera cornea HHB12733 TaxID=1353952 RepID=A0A165HCZ3_9BASI|nr:hypothetical protein CALCODRAFT_431378 [Calocera cornea HHB12733]